MSTSVKTTEDLTQTDLKTLMIRFEAEYIRNKSIWTKLHNIPNKLTDLRATIKRRMTLETEVQVKEWLLEIKQETENLHALLHFHYVNDYDILDMTNIIYAMLERSQPLLSDIAKMTWPQLKVSLLTEFPLYTEEVISFYSKITPHLPGRYWAHDWNMNLNEYRGQGGDKLLNYMSHNINYISDRMTEGHLTGLNGHFTDTCPPAYLRTIMTPHGQTDCSRAVWCIYSELKERGFDLPFSKDVMIEMEDWLSRSSSSSPQKQYPLCAEVLMDYFKTFQLPLLWKNNRKRLFALYTQDKDSVKLLTACSFYINSWYKMRKDLSMSTLKVGDLGPETFNVKIMSPNGKTDWTRMVWLIKRFCHNEYVLTPNILT